MEDRVGRHAQVAPSIDARKARKECQRMVKIASPKPDPPGHHSDERIGSRDDDRRPFETAHEPGALDDEKAPMMRAPNHKRPVRAVPQSAQQENKPKIPIGFE